MNAIHKLMLAFSFFVLASCSHTAFLKVSSVPTGARLTETNSNSYKGIAPIVMQYEYEDLKHYVNEKGCFVVNGFTAEWISGAKTTENSITLCDGVRDDYTISLVRDVDEPNLDADLKQSRDSYRSLYNNGSSGSFYHSEKDKFPTYKSDSSSDDYPRSSYYGYSTGSRDNAPCVIGYCGPVHVDGYYRKNGTYVRSHTRSSPSGRGRR